MDTQPVIIERTYDAPVTKVWQALTDNEKLKQWYFPLPEFRAEVGFEFSFTAGGTDATQYVHRCKITQAIANKKLAYTWRYEGLPGDSEVTFELFDEDGKTRLKLTHTGLESMAANGPDFSKSSFNGGWTHFVNTALKDFLEK